MYQDTKKFRDRVLFAKRLAQHLRPSHVLPFEIALRRLLGVEEVRPRRKAIPCAEEKPRYSAW